MSLADDDTETKIGTDAAESLPDFAALDCAGPVALDTNVNAGELSTEANPYFDVCLIA
jgi:hypothetical protein